MSTTSSEREMRFAEWYARRLWPIHRLFLGGVLAKRCKRCTVPESYSPLEDGVCEVCRSGSAPSSGPSPERKRKMSEELDQVFKACEADSQSQYHCLVLVSGGKDSTYLLHQLKTRYPRLRLLALTVDNTFLPAVALENASRVAAALRVSSIVLRPDPGFYEKIFRHAFLHLDGRLSAVVVDQCDGDILHDTGRIVAARFNIPLVVSGIQAIQVEQYLGLQSYESERSFDESRRTHAAGFELASFLGPAELSYFWDGTKWPKASIPRMLFPFYAWEYNEADVVNTIERLGLIPRRKLSPLATNHKLIPLMGAVDVTRFGYSSYDPEFAVLVRGGLADKGIWQAILEMQEYAIKKNRFVTASIDEVLKRLALTREELGLASGLRQVDGAFRIGAHQTS